MVYIDDSLAKGDVMKLKNKSKKELQQLLAVQVENVRQIKQAIEVIERKEEIEELRVKAQKYDELLANQKAKQERERALQAQNA